MGFLGKLEPICASGEVEVGQDKCGHGFENRYCARDDAGIVAALLCHAAYGTGWFEGDEQNDAFAVGNATLNAIGGWANSRLKCGV